MFELLVKICVVIWPMIYQDYRSDIKIDFIEAWHLDKHVHFGRILYWSLFGCFKKCFALEMTYYASLSLDHNFKYLFFPSNYSIPDK